MASTAGTATSAGNGSAAAFIPQYAWTPRASDYPLPFPVAAPAHAALMDAEHGVRRNDIPLAPSIDNVDSDPTPIWMKLAPVALLVVAVVAFAVWQLMGSGDPDNDDVLGGVGGTATAGLSSTPGAQQPGAGGSLLTPSADATTTVTTTTPGGGGAGSGTSTGTDTEDDDTDSAEATEEDETDGTEPTDDAGSDDGDGDGDGIAASGIPEVTAVEGTTLNGIAADWGISPTTLLWANPEITDPSAPIAAGTIVYVPPVDGVIHTVEEGETIQSIAALYGVEEINITSVIQNGVSDNTDLTIGMRITVAGATPTQRGGLTTYIVQEGDDLWKIAATFGISAETIAYANDIPDLTLIYAGQELVIPPADGVLYTVVSGDTVESIAEHFGVDPQIIRDFPFNNLPDESQPTIGQPILIPGLEPLAYLSEYGAAGGGDGSKDPFAESATTQGDGIATGTFMWPAQGFISQHFNEYHHGIDIANAEYSPVVASDGGTVIFAGWNEYGLGYAVAIDHGNGYVSWYGHFVESPAVNVGDAVSQGQWIGSMGNTGKSTGPHLHFVIVGNGAYVDPQTVLP